MFQIKQPANQQKAFTNLDASITMLKEFIREFAKPRNNVKSKSDDRKYPPVESGVHVVN